MKKFTVVFPVSQHEGVTYILLGKQKPGKPLAGYLNGYGGKLEEGETLLEAAARELMEELGISLDSPVCVASMIHDTKEIFMYLSRADFQNHGDTEEMVENTWYDILDTSFTSEMLPGDGAIIEHVRDNIGRYFQNEEVEELKIVKTGTEIDSATRELDKSIGILK